MSDLIQIKGLPAIPPLGLGTWQWGDRLVWGYGSGYRESDAEAAYRAALQGGVRLFDTARTYAVAFLLPAGLPFSAKHIG